MLKQYIYKPAEVGQREWPQGTLRLNFEVTENPEDADIFVCPGTLALFTDPGMLDSFPYMAGRENRHVFSSIDESMVLYDKPCLFFRCNLKTHMKARDVNAISWPWPVEEYAECMPVPADGFKYDITFHGWLNYTTRIESTQSCLNHPDLKCDMARYPDFTGGIYYTGEGIRRRAEYRRSMKESRLCLCPESIPGDFPYRFFEAMSAGRIPVLVGADQVFPFADDIPYSDFILHMNPGESSRVGHMVAQFLRHRSDEEIVERGRIARAYWERYLNRDRWVEIMTDLVEKKIRALA